MYLFERVRRRETKKNPWGRQPIVASAQFSYFALVFYVQTIWTYFGIRFIYWVLLSLFSLGVPRTKVYLFIHFIDLLYWNKVLISRKTQIRFYHFAECLFKIEHALDNDSFKGLLGRIVTFCFIKKRSLQRDCTKSFLLCHPIWDAIKPVRLKQFCKR